MPELDLGLAESPAEQHLPAGHLAREIHESHAPILELNAQFLELALIPINLGCERLCFPLELGGAFVWFLRSRSGGYEVQLEDLFAPLPVLPHNVLDDSPHERQGPVGFVNSEEAGHDGNLRAF